jgi:hypothetical protein
VPMFKTHLVAGVAAGTVYGGLGLCKFPPEICLISAGVCALSSLLPDLDTKSKIFREVAIFAGVCAALLMSAIISNRSSSLSFPKNPYTTSFVIGVISYVVVRFLLCGVLLKLTVHRGTLHSILMALILAEITYMLFIGPKDVRAYIGYAFFLGYILHLGLDEWGSLGKKPYGTAFKLWGPNLIINGILTIFAVFLTILVVYN